jgi:hypothetical protein
LYSFAYYTSARQLRLFINLVDLVLHHHHHFKASPIVESVAPLIMVVVHQLQAALGSLSQQDREKLQEIGMDLARKLVNKQLARLSPFLPQQLNSAP